MSEVKEEVKAAIDAAAGESSVPAEVVSAAPAVKEPVIEPVVPIIDKDPSELRKQIDNLNTALKTERESSKSKLGELTKKLDESVAVLDRFKNVFVPEVKEEPKEAIYATQEDVERAVEKKLQSLKEEESQNQKVLEYKQEIKTLETEWDGKDGKPSYNDQEVLEWQRSNDKLVLSPRDAFLQMKHNEIIDYEVKQRLNGVKPAIDVERPSSVGGDHQPDNSKIDPNMDTRDAIRQAIEEASKEM
ncbi:MAG: hypothetical protein WC938_03540 [Candidatus Paceibacterota bacterium]|jgi:hypothetical protein